MNDPGEIKRSSPVQHNPVVTQLECCYTAEPPRPGADTPITWYGNAYLSFKLERHDMETVAQLHCLQLQQFQVCGSK